MVVTRRKAIVGATLLAAAGGIHAAPRRPSPHTFVLVHGAWHGGWCWRDVADRLRADGHRVFTPTLTGMGERLHLGRPDTNMSTHVADVAAVIECEELSDVVLVAHSYAGHPGSYVAARMPERVRRLIYLDSLLPTPGKAMMTDAPPATVKAVEASLIDGFRLPSFPPEQFNVPADHPRHAWVKRRLTTMPWGCITELHPPLPAAFDRIDKLYVRCMANTLPDSSRDAAEAARRGLTVVDLDAGHDAMITAPEATAAVLTKLA